MLFLGALHEFQWLSNTTFIDFMKIPVFCANLPLSLPLGVRYSPHLPPRPPGRLVNKDVDAAVGSEEMNARFRREAAYMSGPFITGHVQYYNSPRPYLASKLCRDSDRST